MIGSVLLLAVMVILAAVVGTMAMGFLQESPTDAQRVLAEDQCPGFQVVEFDPSSVDAAADKLRTRNCALWLEQGNVQTTANNTVKLWGDEGKHGFDAAQTDDGDRPELVHDSDLGANVLEFDATQPAGADDRGDNSGQYLKLERNVDDLDIDENTGMVAAAVIKVDEFDRGGTWTIGKAGTDGKEFSMRTCSDRSADGCEHSDPEGHWRGQHWGSADVDFSSGEASADEWITLVHAYDGDQVTIRVNGKEVAQRDVDLDLSDDRDIQIGRWERTAGDPHWYFDGRIAELVLFDEALETGEMELIEAYFNQKYGTPQNGPIDS
jgi:hypothetical protein